mgnify:CR=1 FL=1
MKHLLLSSLIIFFAINNFVIAQNLKSPSGQSKISSLRIIQDDKPKFIGVREILRICTDNTLDLLKQELEIRRRAGGTIVLLFFGKNIYRGTYLPLY